MNPEEEISKVVHYEQPSDFPLFDLLPDKTKERIKKIQIENPDSKIILI